MDIVAFGAHPDDVELTCGGALAKSARQGRRVAVVDATRGELGTRGSVATREREAAAASRILGLSHRESLGLPDGGLSSAPEALRAIVGSIRRLRPHIVIAPSDESRHPDHVALARLVREACFFAGVRRWEAEGPAWRPQKMVITTTYLPKTPSFFVDVTSTFAVKLRAIRAYASQLRGASHLGDVPATGRNVLDTIHGIHEGYGALARVRFAEPFTMTDVAVVEDLMDLKR